MRERGRAVQYGAVHGHTPAAVSAAPDADEEEHVEVARRTIDATTDASPNEDGVHTMGAAVRSSDGRTFSGVNLYHFTGGPCAELVALGAARANGATAITHVVAVGNHGRGPVGPCGCDRQILFDYNSGVRAIVPTRDGVRSVEIADLLPLATGWAISDGSTTAWFSPPQPRPRVGMSVH